MLYESEASVKLTAVVLGFIGPRFARGTVIRLCASVAEHTKLADKGKHHAFDIAGTDLQQRSDLV